MSGKAVLMLLPLLCVGGILTAKGQDVRTDINMLLELAENIDENVEDLEDDIDDVGDDIDNLEDEIEDFGEGIEDMETDVETVTAEMVKLREEVRTELGDVKEELVSLRTGLEEKVDNLEEKVDNVEEKMCIAMQELTGLQRDMNSTLYILQELKNQLITMRQEMADAHHNTVQHEDLIALHNSLGESCSQLHPTSLSGYYWLRGLPAAERVYCDMDRQSCGCGNPWGWMRVANIDMTDPNQQCPEGFRLRPGTSTRMCEMTVDSYDGACASIVYPTHSVQYSKVCGRVKAYQFRSPDALHPYYVDRSRTIDEVYVDGVSITHGQSPRKHIWTFAAIANEMPRTHVGCPCSKTDTTYTGVVPPFIGNDYFCDTGSRQRWESRLYTEDPLWDGEGCGPTSSCCQFNSPPWFCKELPQPTSDDIEVRVCRDQRQSDEETPFEQIELFVR